MALTKPIQLPNGAAGSYIKLGFLAIDWIERECSAHFLLFTSQDQKDSAPNKPLCLIGKLRLAGEKFDEYLSAAALAELKGAGPDPLRDQLYAAAQAEPDCFSPGGGLTRDQLQSLIGAARAD